MKGQLDQLRASFPVEGENDLDAAVIGYFALKEFGKHFNIIILQQVDILARPRATTLISNGSGNCSSNLYWST